MIYKNIVVFISGNGTNMLSIIHATKKTGYPAKVIGVISDNPNAKGIIKAKEENIPIYTIPYNNYKSTKEHEKAIITQISSIKPDLICLAGYIRILSKEFIENYKNKILNIHPSLLPLFPGLHTHRRALKSGVKITGCTVHIVTENIDEGPIVAQAAIPILSDETEESLSKRLLSVENILYPLALEKIILGKIEKVEDRFHIIGI
ncbi:phosphoribosylglycinamide formyltransferase [Candidatus Liberibacter americanus]|uniref:Phosphoribosylglycinamide formyltransferase n=1 Tax=Candidatus Liberibacter americanus str. Sao Paulo TaxID=1261131 RepID=U6B6B5_9HYPH|nr:phosphoribosylglycinamide formyltransferase [Candidatus Liberibacter americanus]AHA28319.1 Folate-dependent phosphoribosylglycinamide formyltransferase PurN [Candidatus Liberibacter americanus str. Sao Paulo]EMS36609.1 phosphoribosylglycinamide formyltransferase [Candidatus Liberibacter americanus PW_SP]